MSVQTQQIHRRKMSREDIDIVATPAVEVTVPEDGDLPTVAISSPPARRPASGHSHSRSISMTGQPPSGGPYRSSFAPRPLNGQPLASPLRTSFSMNSHSRTRSISTPFSPVAPSPLSSSFPTRSPTSPKMPTMSPSHSAPETMQQPEAPQKHARRHSRMHSRNLSVFFPRPGSLGNSTISEDGSQEVEMRVDEEAPLMPSAGSSVSMPGSRARGPITPLGQGFTFGARPPSHLPSPELMTAPRSSSASKRGHHHKHSVSHNFFSFLEPGSTTEELHTQPTPTPMSPWQPMSAISTSTDSAAATSNGFKVPARKLVHQPQPEEISPSALTVSVAQFVLGAYLWVTGQQVGSLSCTGLGYWVVFDSFGVALTGVVPGWLASGSKREEDLRRPYGKGRIETVLLFAQAVYLMFSAVYVCKETVEHLLLSAGGGEGGHHHHHGDEQGGFGIDFPIFMTFFTFLSMAGTAFFFQNNTKLVHISGNRIPSLSTLLRSIWSPSRHTLDSPPSSPLAVILSNPFVSCPLFFCLSILFVALAMPPAQHSMADLVLAMIIAAVTFKVSYRASVVLGTVLLQTSPPRGLASGKMEAFLRAMREVERHPHVLHLPAPHIWQLTPSYASSVAPSYSSPVSTKQAPSESLVVTLELHVREDLGDDDVLKLTKWAWERCVSALGSLKDFRELGEEGAPEVTVGVVRG
ncbi:hypothetical protein D9619_010097 [Psilocybe cf. subviscida]|uniref:Cation efflux protein transmembrane domain-containing protein n=1 Tax=Psilocybe cf. subviscida TaxID=2480587 RepID=A0A8H5BKU3_9AGAR|nr:hypothetical protein D9619_010097 [Psilocybe cf. subviscida]